MQAISQRKKEEREALEKQMAAYLKNGGKVKTLPSGKSNISLEKLDQRLTVKPGWKGGMEGLNNAQEKIKKAVERGSPA